MNTRANSKPNIKPSDFSVFASQVYQASATMMDFPDYLDLYGEILQVIFWNPEVDTPIALREARLRNLNPSGVVLNG